MKFILYIHSDPQIYPPIINAATILAEKGNQVYLIGYKLNSPGYIAINSKITTKYFGTLHKGLRGVLQYMYSFLKLFLLILHIKPNWIISFDAYASFPVFLNCLFFKKKWVYYQHDFWENPLGMLQKILHKAERIAASNASLVCFPQKDRLNIFQNQINKPLINTVIVHNGPRKDWAKRHTQPHPIILKLKEKFNYILVYQGGWSSDFKLEVFVKMIPFTKSNFCILFLGKEHEIGVKNKLLDIAKGLYVENRVFFSNDYIPYDSISSLTQFCSIGFAIPTIETDCVPINNIYLAGASNKLGEYLACGLPILATKSIPNFNFFEEYKTAFYFDPNDPSTLGELIDSLLFNKDMLIKIYNHNLDVFNSQLNFDFQFEKLINAMNQYA